MTDLNKFIEWFQQDTNNRTVSIEIKECAIFKGVRADGSADYDIVRVHVWDSSLSAGQFVQRVEEIDIPAAQKRQRREKYEQLKAEFEPQS